MSKRFIERVITRLAGRKKAFPALVLALCVLVIGSGIVLPGEELQFGSGTLTPFSGAAGHPAINSLYHREPVVMDITLPEVRLSPARQARSRNHRITLFVIPSPLPSRTSPPSYFIFTDSFRASGTGDVYLCQLVDIPPPVI